jgi:iron(III) transport system substrate-binding protein
VSLGLLVLSALVLLASGCGQESPTVVVYTSIDQVYSEPILDAFQEKTGITVKAVYDVEAAKTVGLANRLVSEKSHPVADVWWNGEILETLRLKEEGVLAPFTTANTKDIPSQFVDAEGYWVGATGRARTLIVNTDLLSPGEYPSSIYDLLDPAWPADKVGIAYPMFGTASTQAAALYAVLGEDKARQYYQGIADRGVRVVDGNSVVKDMVASGQLQWGLTDTDDAAQAINDGRPVTVVFPDQGEGQLGTLIIPSSVGLIKGAPHPEEAQALIDYLTSAEVERTMIASGWSHLPVRPLAVKQDVIDVTGVRGMDVQYDSLFEWLEPSRSELAAIIVR